MKFLEKNKFLKISLINDDNDFIFNLYNDYDEESFINLKFLKFNYLKKNIKNRKIFLKIRKGLTSTEKKNSLKRDSNFSIVQQYINVSLKGGNKDIVFKNLDKAVEIIFFSFNDENEEFIKYKNFFNLNFLVNNFIDYCDFSFLLGEFLPQYYSVFDIKTKKNHKKSRKIKKYSHEIIYIPENKRLKNTLKVLNMYTNNFKNYELWERLFWMFTTVINNKKNSYIYKRRAYIYKKSIRFFVNRK